MPPTPEEFSCEAAPRLLGRPESTVRSCGELLPGLWTVVLEGGGIPEGQVEGHAARWLDGVRAVDVGPGALARYLRRIDAHQRDDFTYGTVLPLLTSCRAFPEGFATHSLSSQETPERGLDQLPNHSFVDDGVMSATISSQPFALTLIQLGARPRPPFVPIPGGPTMPPPDSPGPRAGRRLPGARGCGRATLTLNAAYEGEWIIEGRDFQWEPFDVVYRVPVAPDL